MRELYFNRYLFYLCLVVVGGMMLIEATPRYTRLHGVAQDRVDPFLDFTGLWQGSWELFAPTPDHVNVKVLAIIDWNDGSETIWGQPDWHAMSPWQKMRAFREMSYYDSLWRPTHTTVDGKGFNPAWVPFCEQLAVQESEGSIRTPEEVNLYVAKDVIPPPNRKWRPAYSAPEFGDPERIYRWIPEKNDRQ